MQDYNMYEKFPPLPATMGGGYLPAERNTGLVILYQVLKWLSIVLNVIFLFATVYALLIVVHDEEQARQVIWPFDSYHQNRIPTTVILGIGLLASIYAVYVYCKNLRVPIIVFACLQVVAFLIDLGKGEPTEAVGYLLGALTNFGMADLIKQGYHKGTC